MASACSQGAHGFVPTIQTQIQVIRPKSNQPDQPSPPNTRVPYPERAPVRAGGDASQDSHRDYELLCPPRTVVVAFAGGAGDWLDRLGPLTCSDGSQTGMTNDGNGGGPFNIVSTSFFLGISDVMTGSWIDRVYIRTGSGTESYHGNNENARQGPSLCPQGSVLAGIYGRGTDSIVSAVGAICRAILGGWLCECNEAP